MELVFPDYEGSSIVNFSAGLLEHFMAQRPSKGPGQKNLLGVGIKKQGTLLNRGQSYGKEVLTCMWFT